MVKSPDSGQAGCSQARTIVKNTPGGSTGTLCMLLPPQNQKNLNDATGVEEELPDNSILTTNAFDSTVTVTKPFPASCKAQGTFRPNYEYT